MAGYVLVDIEWTDEEGRGPTADRALAWHDSEDYAPLRRIREQSARRNMIFFEGD